MPDLVAGGGVDRCGAVPGGEVVPVGETGDVADLDQQSGRAGGSDAVQVHQTGAGGCDQVAQFLVGRFGARVDPFEVGDQFCGDPTPGLACDVTGPHLG